jgi:hypothetical protein
LFIHHSGPDHPDIRPLKMSHDAALPPGTSFHGGKSSTFSSREFISDGAHALHFVTSQHLLAFFIGVLSTRLRSGTSPQACPATSEEGQQKTNPQIPNPVFRPVEISGFATIFNTGWNRGGADF